MKQQFKLLLLSAIFLVGSLLYAGSYKGHVVLNATADDLFNVRVVLVELGRSTTTDLSGNFKFEDVPDGNYTLRIEGGGIEKLQKQVSIKGDVVESDDIVAMLRSYDVEELQVYSSSRRMEKLTQAPSAISLVTKADIEKETAHGQIGKTMEGLPGVSVVQSGMNDFNINTRGFNNSINRRVLVMVDGIDPSTPMLNLVEWNSFGTGLYDIERIEVVRGPGSALYGMNAYNGVINITTVAPKDALGTRVGLLGGEYETYGMNARHATELSENLFIKVNAGYRHQRQSWVNSREFGYNGQPIDGGFLEYPGLAPDRPGNRGGFGVIDADNTWADVIEDRKGAYNMFGNLRVDKYLDEDNLFTFEAGMSKYGNEYFVNQTGRILIPEIDKPWVRLAFNNTNWSIQTHWIRRFSPITQAVMNAAATSGELSDVVHSEVQWNDIFLDDKLRVILGVSGEYQNVRTDIRGSLPPILNPSQVEANFLGTYGQLEYAILDNLDFIVASRFDVASDDLFEPQLSPKAGLVWEPIENQTFRATVNRSFLRPSYPEFFRVSPAGAPIANLDSVDQAIATKYGVDALGLASSTNVWNYGNVDLDVESAVSYEFGYKGIISDDLFITTDLYYNQRSNFISNPLPNLARDKYIPNNDYGNAEANQELLEYLKATTGSFGQRNYDGLALDPNYGGKTNVIVAPENIAEVNEYGVEIAVNYYILDELLLTGNYSWLNYDVPTQTAGTEANKILPNTSPSRVNLGFLYEEKEGEFPWHFGTEVRGVAGFDWVAGLITGHVPEYWLVNINGGVELTENIDLGFNVFNLLDRHHYQIFGGTYLGRYATMNLVFDF